MWSDIYTTIEMHAKRAGYKCAHDREWLLVTDGCTIMSVFRLANMIDIRTRIDRAMVFVTVDQAVAIAESWPDDKSRRAEKMRHRVLEFTDRLVSLLLRL